MADETQVLRPKDAEATINAALKDISGLASKMKDLVEEHAEKHGDGKNDFDFLHVKNTLFVSYIIDLVYYVQLRSKKSSDDSSIKACLNRLNEMRVILDKIRPMEKKLAYPLQKLLAAAENLAGSLDHNDPLSFRPDMDALDNDGDDISSDDNASDDADSGSGSDEDDDDLKAAKAAARSSSSKKGSQNAVDKASTIYKAPRLAAVHYEDKESKIDKAEKMQQRQASRMRKTELLQTLRHQYSDRPEEDDMFGGAKLGTTKDAAKRIVEKEAEKLAYEEKAMVRLPTTKKERKEKNRVTREEISNLGSLADLTDLSAGVKAFNRSNRSGDKNERDHSGGKRRKPAQKQSRSSGSGAKNSLQSALYGTDGGSSSKKRKKR